MQDSENNVVEIIFVVIYFLHQFPSLVLIVLILFHRNPFKSTLFTRAKVYLFLAFLLWLPDEIPLTIWSAILPDDCYAFFSLVDVVHAVYSCSIIMFFLFLREEYHQNLVEGYWKTVNDIQLHGGVSNRTLSLG